MYMLGLYSIYFISFHTDVSANDLLQKLKSGFRVPRPHGCPDILYELMTQCWDANSSLRPTFEYIQVNYMWKLSI